MSQHVAVDDDDDKGELLDVTSAEAVLTALGEMPSLRKSGKRPAKLVAVKPAPSTVATPAAASDADGDASAVIVPAAADDDAGGAQAGLIAAGLIAAAAAAYYYYPQLGSFI